MNTLHLNLKRKWFEMILSGEKKEEYRSITQYWADRLVLMVRISSTINYDRCDRLVAGDYEKVFWEEFDTITFSNGYAKDRDQFVIELKGIEIKEGNPAWGAEQGTKYFCLQLGNILSKRIK